MIGAVDDHPVALLGIVEGLGAHLSDPWIHPVRSVDELLDAAIDFDVVILDVRLNDGREPRENVERLVARGWPVILFTSMTHVDPQEREAVAQCLVAGANAIVGKDDGVGCLAESIRAVRGGGIVMNSHWAAAVRTAMKEQNALTRSELQVLRLRRAGMSRGEMAQHLHVAPETIKTHVSSINNKLNGQAR